MPEPEQEFLQTLKSISQSMSNQAKQIEKQNEILEGIGALLEHMLLGDDEDLGAPQTLSDD